MAKPKFPSGTDYFSPEAHADNVERERALITVQEPFQCGITSVLQSVANQNHQGPLAGWSSDL